MREKYKCIYDIETYPNLATFVFKDYENQKYYDFILYADPENPANNINQIKELLDFIEKRLAWAIGYNSSNFDDVITKALWMDAPRLRFSDVRKTVTEIKGLAQEIIDGNNSRAYAYANIKAHFRSLDLMLLYNPVDQVSLKQLAIGMQYPVIMENPFEHDHIITKDEIQQALIYNRNDVDITERLLYELSEEVNNRIAYTIKFGTDVLNASNSTIGRRILMDYYSKESGTPQKDLKKMRTNYDKLPLADCISKKISFRTKEYNKMLEKVKEKVIDPNLKDVETAGMNKLEKRELKKQKKLNHFEAILRSKYVTHSMQLGGLHSENVAEILEENEFYVYIDIDVRGYYPRLIINERLFPAHLDERFVDIFKEKIVDEREKVVKEDPILSYMLKIAANATFGLTDTESWLKDPKMAKTITISGQLFLFMLMEGIEMYTKGIVVYSNTDGLTIRVPRNQINWFMKVCERWEQYTGFTLEYNYYRKMIIRDVNNYLMFTHSTDPKKRIKAKGAYVIRRPIYKGYNYPIIALAVQEYYDKGTSVEATILSNTNIYNFMKAERTSMEKFDVVLFPKDPKKDTRLLQKNNRWIVTDGNPEEGRLFKIKKDTKERIAMQSEWLVTPIPNVQEGALISSYNLNYKFYVGEAEKLIDLTHPLDDDTRAPQPSQGVLEFT